jgi:hypothetical protein
MFIDPHATPYNDSLTRLGRPTPESQLLAAHSRFRMCWCYQDNFVHSRTTEVHSCTANAGQSIKEVDSVVPGWTGGLRLQQDVLAP